MHARRVSRLGVAVVVALLVALSMGGRTEAAAGGKALVLLLHPYGGSGAGVSWFFKMSGLGTRAVVLTPDASIDPEGKRAWNASRSCCNPTGPNDVAILSDLVMGRLRQGDIDPDRVYVWGYSNGGFMAWRLLCERADLFRSVVIVEGGANAPGDAPCTPTRPVNVLHVHGTADDTVPYRTAGHVSGMPENLPSVIHGSLEQEAATMRCQGRHFIRRFLAFDHDLLAPGAETDVFAAGDCEARVEHWQMAGTNHVPLLSATWALDLLNWSDGRLPW